MSTYTKRGGGCPAANASFSPVPRPLNVAAAAVAASVTACGSKVSAARLEGEARGCGLLTRESS